MAHSSGVKLCGSLRNNENAADLPNAPGRTLAPPAPLKRPLTRALPQIGTTRTPSYL